MVRTSSGQGNHPWVGSESSLPCAEESKIQGRCTCTSTGFAKACHSSLTSEPTTRPNLSRQERQKAFRPLAEDNYQFAYDYSIEAGKAYPSWFEDTWE